MTAALDVELDHTGTIVRDLARAAAQWQRLGFTLSPLSPQSGLKADGSVEPWATANHCAVFEQGYLELIGLHRPECFNPWAARLERHEGAHIAAFRIANADAGFAQLEARSADFQPPLARRRDAPFFDGERWGTREMRFRNIFSIDARVPEARYIVIEHQTPEILWQPALLQHPNGALALESFTFCADDDAAIRARLALLASEVPANEHASAHYRCRAGGDIEVLTPSQWQQRFPGEPALTHTASGRIGSCRVRVADLTATASWLEQQRVACQRDGQRLWVGAEHTGGTPLEFN